MQTIKTSIVVVLLLAVCYGAFVALNAPEPEIPQELLSDFDWAGEQTDFDNMMNIELPGGDATPDFQVATTGEIHVPDFDLTSDLPEIDTSNLGVPDFAADSSHTPATGAPQLGDRASSAPEIGLPQFPAVADDKGASEADLDGPAVTLPTHPTSTPNPLKFASDARTASDESHAPEMQLPLLQEGASQNSRASRPDSNIPTEPFSIARTQALELAAGGKLKESLRKLSPYYESPELTHAEHSDLVNIMDALTREVIYSARHLVEPAHVATASDTLESIAAKYQVTPELLKAINHIGESNALAPGTQVKVVKGPFRAAVSLARGELTLFLGELYAGRFPITVGKDPSPVEGAFEIVDRRRDRTYYVAGGKFISTNDPRNPYGGYWLNLGQDLCIHGTAEMASSDLVDAGCISLAPRDAADVYSILAQGSQVEIKR